MTAEIESSTLSGLVKVLERRSTRFWAGIAILSTYVTSHIQLHRVDLVANTYTTNPVFVQRQQQLVHGLIAQGFPPYVAQQKALAVMDAIVSRQAAMLAYNDAWILILLSFLVVAPAIIFLRKPRARAIPVDAH